MSPRWKRAATRNRPDHGRIKRDYRALIPLLRHRYEPDNPAVKELLNRPRDVHMSIDAALQMRASEILSQHLVEAGQTERRARRHGSFHRRHAGSRQLSVAIARRNSRRSKPARRRRCPRRPARSRALRTVSSGIRPLRLSPPLRRCAKIRRSRSNAIECIRLPGGRVGNFVWKREIRDDIKDTQPHGSVDLQKGIVVSCNAYFAQLGAYSVGAQMLFDTAATGHLRRATEYAQKTAAISSAGVLRARTGCRVAISDGACCRDHRKRRQARREGRWIIDETNSRVRPPQPLLSPSLANQIGGLHAGCGDFGNRPRP